MTITKVVTYLDLLYSNSICRQSSMPTSIFMLLFISGYCDNVCTIMSCSLTESDKRFTIVTRKKYLLMKRYHNKQRMKMKNIHSLWKFNTAIYQIIEFIMHCCSNDIVLLKLNYNMLLSFNNLMHNNGTPNLIPISKSKIKFVLNSVNIFIDLTSLIFNQSDPIASIHQVYKQRTVTSHWHPCMTRMASQPVETQTHSLCFQWSPLAEQVLWQGR